MKKKPFELVMINPGSKGENGSRHPNYLAKSPGGTIPCIEDDSGFTLSEAHAILTYLSRINGWTDVYPDDEEQRAKVDWYLHYHHRNVRDASLGLVAPKIRKDLDIPELIQDNAKRTLSNALNTLDSILAGQKHIACDSLTLADIAAYVEIGQVKPEFTNVFDLSDYSNVVRWLNDMSQVEGHDDVHVVLAELGDISEQAPDMERIKNANISALKTLKAKLAEFG